MGYLLCKTMVVYDYSGSLQQGKPYKTQCTPAFLDLVYGRHCAIVTVFFFFLSLSSAPLCFIYNIVSASLILHYPDPPRVGPRSHWPASAFPLGRRRLVGSAHRQRVANRRAPLISPGQCPRPSHLHRDGASQSGVSTGEDFDPSTQWQWEV